MGVLFQQLFNGFMLGSTYALVGLGLTLVFGILHIPNFSHGASYMLAAYVAYTLIMILELNFWVSLLIAFVIFAVMGFLIERFIFRPLYGRTQASPIIAGIGLMMIMESGVHLIWGSQGKRITNPYPEDINAFGIIMGQQKLIVIIFTVALIVLLIIFIKKSILGTTIEAVAQNREGASLMGINVNFTCGMTFGISTALCSIAATLIAPIYMLNTSMGSILGMKCFAIVIIGGLGSIPGAIVGGYILGFIEALGAGYFSATFKDVYAFGFLVILLTIKPTGLFGKEIR